MLEGSSAYICCEIHIFHWLERHLCYNQWGVWCPLSTFGPYFGKLSIFWAYSDIWLVVHILEKLSGRSAGVLLIILNISLKMYTCVAIYNNLRTLPHLCNILVARSSRDQAKLPVLHIFGKNINFCHLELRSRRTYCIVKEEEENSRIFLPEF